MNLHFNKDDLKTIPCAWCQNNTEFRKWQVERLQAILGFINVFFLNITLICLYFHKKCSYFLMIFKFSLRDTCKSKWAKKSAPLYDSCCKVTSHFVVFLLHFVAAILVFSDISVTSPLLQMTAQLLKIIDKYLLLSCITTSKNIGDENVKYHLNTC